MLQVPDNDTCTDRTCRVCNKCQPLENFGIYKAKSRKNALRRHICRTCNLAYEHERYKRPGIAEKAKLSARKSRLYKVYGLTIEDYQALYKQQAGKCKICSIELPEGKINVDHCHDTGKVRSLLCWTCNIGIGHFKNDVKLLQNAITYLEEHRNGTNVTK